MTSDLDLLRQEKAAIARATPVSNATAQVFAKYFAPVGVKGFNVTQNFGAKEDGGFHTGIDIGVQGRTDAAAVSVTDGTVVHAGFVTRSDGSPSYGNLVVVRDKEGYLHYYAHLAGFAVSIGQQVAAGTALGVVGSTGNSTGIHLHYEVRDLQGQPVDPSKDLSEPVHGVTAQGVYAPSTTPVYAAPSNSYGSQLDSPSQTHGDLGSFIPADVGFDEDTIGISDAVAKALGLAPIERNGVTSTVHAASLKLKAMGVDIGN